MRNLLIAASVTLIAAAALVFHRVLAHATEDLATSSLWPRPDGSVRGAGGLRTYGEIWDWSDAA
jgi:hypothetical protein